MHTSAPKATYYLRHYIVLATIILAGIFLIFVFADDIENTILNSAIVSDQGVDDLEIRENVVKKVKKDTTIVEISLIFSDIPQVTEEIKVEELEVISDDFKTSININDNKLELNNLEEINLGLKDFKGEIHFDENALTLDGTAKRIEVNSLAFSSDKGIEVRFDRLGYNYISLPEISLSEIEFTEGDGQLEIAEKLEYTLEGEDLLISNFEGSLEINKAGNSTVAAEGTAGKISVSGNVLTFEVD